MSKRRQSSYYDVAIKSVDFKKSTDETPIKILSVKSNESCLVKIYKFWNPEVTHASDVKNFMANERTFLNF